MRCELHYSPTAYLKLHQAISYKLKEAKSGGSAHILKQGHFYLHWIGFSH